MTTGTTALQEAVRELIRDKGHRVHEWPDDEAAAYRDNGGFAPGRQAVEDLRVAKGVAAIEKIIAAEVQAAKAEAWDEATRIALNFAYLNQEDRITLYLRPPHNRNPYRATEYETGDRA